MNPYQSPQSDTTERTATTDPLSPSTLLWWFCALVFLFGAWIAQPGYVTGILMGLVGGIFSQLLLQDYRYKAMK